MPAWPPWHDEKSPPPPPRKYHDHRRQPRRLKVSKTSNTSIFSTRHHRCGDRKAHPPQKTQAPLRLAKKVTRKARRNSTPRPDLIINLGSDQEIGRPALKPVVVAPAVPLPPPPPKVDPKDPEANFFAARIQPVLERTCTGCHGTEKQKNKFQAHTLELLVKGGEDNGAGIVPGKPDESSAIKRIRASPGRPRRPHATEGQAAAEVKKRLDCSSGGSHRVAEANKKVKETQVPGGTVNGGVRRTPPPTRLI